MTILTKEDELDIYRLVLRGYKQTEIAKKYGITQSYVSRIYHDTIKRNDRDLAVSSALEFVAEYNKAKDYLIMKQQELEVLLNHTDDIKEKEKIIMSQVAITQILITHVMQGKFVQAVQEFGYSKQLEDHSE